MELRGKLIRQQTSISHKKQDRVQDLDEMLFLWQELAPFISLSNCHPLKLRGSLGVISISD